MHRGNHMEKMKTRKLEEPGKPRENKTASARLSQIGLTVVELLIAFSVLAVILLLTAPGISALVQDHYLKSAGSELYASLSLARNEAKRRHSTVRMCPSSDGKSCRGDGDWNKGWLVFSDGNANGVPDDIEMIQAFAAPSDKVRIYATGAVMDSASFTVAGLSGNEESDTGSFKVCLTGSDSGFRKVTVDQDGWAEIIKVDASCNAG